MLRLLFFVGLSCMGLLCNPVVTEKQQDVQGEDWEGQCQIGLIETWLFVTGKNDGDREDDEHIARKRGQCVSRSEWIEQWEYNQQRRKDAVV